MDLLYIYIHNALCMSMHLPRLLFAIYLLFLLCLTSSLTLASTTSDPRKYHGGWDGLRLFCEIMSLLYLTVVAVLNTIRMM